MKIVLATGIYPPDIGGPATYCRALAQELQKLGHKVTVVTYRENKNSRLPDEQGTLPEDFWSVICVQKNGGPFLRWRRYSRALKKHGADADIVYAFSSVSCGVPLRFASLKNPRKILRLGGDFLWERYTDRGGKLGLREWYTKKGSSFIGFGSRLLKHFDHIVFSSAFQRDIYIDHYNSLPAYSILENAVPSGIPVLHEKHAPLRLLFLGRLVGFKNLSALIEAVKQLPRTTLTIAGSGPMLTSLQACATANGVADHVAFIGNRDGSEKQKLFYEHDLLVLPSLTEISPNVALEARAVGMPVLLTEQNGLSPALQKGMIVRDLQDVERITSAICEVEKKYTVFAEECALPALQRSWGIVAREHMELFSRLSA